MEAQKRNLKERQESTDEKPKLNLDEVILIFQRLPTSELIRFISSKSNHPLGKFWSRGLKFVVEKRLPFSLRATAANAYRSVVTNHVIYDGNGSKVAEIRQPKYFHLSPICELIEAVELPVRFCGLNGMNLLPSRLALPALTSLNSLKLSFWENTSWRRYWSREDEVLLAAALSAELMSHLEALSLSADYTSGRHDEALKAFADVLAGATSLKQLSVTEMQFFALMSRDISGPNHPHTLLTMSAVASAHVGNVFSNLLSLSIRRGRGNISSEWILEFIRTRCTRLCELELPLRGLVRDYLAAFQSLPDLTRLGLDLDRCDRTKLAVESNDAAVTSVTEFRLGLHPYSNDEPSLLALLSKLPNLRTLDLQTCTSDFMLRFASAVCSSGILRHLQTLKCSRNVGPSSCDALLRFIQTNNVSFPTTVDLSQMLILYETRGREFLVDLYRAVESSTVTSLIFRATVAVDEVDRLREHLSLKQKTSQGVPIGKVLAWRNVETSSASAHRDDLPLGQQHTRFTDVKIEGTKTSGPAKGAAFKIRIYHG